jgi:branched-subunit amino acid aminotransferase/4-amino-4-deoxychorismate lyase
MLHPYGIIDGIISPVSQMNISPADLAVTRGFGIFDYFDVRNFTPIFLEDYLARFYQSAATLGMTVPYDVETLKNQIFQIIEANQSSEAGIRMVLTGGFSEGGYRIEQERMFILSYHPPVYPDHFFNKGIKVTLYTHQRELPQVKSINYLTGLYLQPKLKEWGTDYVLYHDGKLIRESDRANFFMVDDQGILVTPEKKILHGITRKKIIHLASEHQIPFDIRDIELHELSTCQEAFLSNTTAKIIPICQIDGRDIGKGSPGTVTLKLMHLFQELLIRHAHNKAAFF